MKKIIGTWKTLGGFFRAFVIIAFLFLAIGLATLGSTYSTGDAYSLRTKQTGDRSTPSVVFRLRNLTTTNENGGTTTTSLRLVGAYVDIAMIYADAGTPATLRLERSASGTSWVTGLSGVFENFYTPEPTLDENGNTVENITQPDVTDVFYNFVSPFSFPATGWSVSTYPYIGLSLTDASPNVLINEVVFVGEKLNTDGEGSGEYCVIPAEIHDATPYANETTQEAIARAGALLDAQQYPTKTQSSFYRYGKDEVYSLMTISEMRQGSEYATDTNGNPADTYTIDNVYGAFGHDFLALGVAIFGMSPFGLRFFPMLAAFGALLVLARFVVRLTKSEKAGLIFTLLYVFCNLTLGYGHLGTPLMLGIFFFACALSLVHAFYAHGIKKANIVSVLPLLFAGLFGAAAICTSGAFLIPVCSVLVLFACGMIRQQTAKNYKLEKALSAEDGAPVSGSEGEVETPEHRAGKVVSEYRFKNTAAPVLLFAGLILGTFLFALVGMLPAYFTYLKAFDNPASPTMNVFAVAWKAFANGFVGNNAFTSGAWSVFYRVYEGSGLNYALTAVAINPVALLAAAAGVVFAIIRLVLLLQTKEHDRAWRSELRATLIPFVGLVFALIAAVAVKAGLAFVVLSYLFAFILAANLFSAGYEGKAAQAVKWCGIIGTVLLVLCFLVFAVFTFSIPLPGTFLTSLFA